LERRQFGNVREIEAAILAEVRDDAQFAVSESLNLQAFRPARKRPCRRGGPIGHVPWGTAPGRRPPVDAGVSNRAASTGILSFREGIAPQIITRVSTAFAIRPGMVCRYCGLDAGGGVGQSKIID